jgi:hypothetical protein
MGKQAGWRGIQRQIDYGRSISEVSAETSDTETGQGANGNPEEAAGDQRKTGPQTQKVTSDSGPFTSNRPARQRVENDLAWSAGLQPA